MTDYKQLCAELLRAMDEIEECETVDWSLVKTKPLKMANQSMAEARAALAEPEPEVYYEFSVSNDEYCIEAGGTAPTLQQAIDEGRHYFAEYSQDGLYTLEVRRVETIPVTY